MLKVGLTGGIATGKSTVAKMLQEKGALLIDFDVLTRQAQEPGKDAWKAIVNYFGGGILNEDKTINRGKLGEIVFNDREQLNRLNEIVHPILFKEWAHIIAEIYQTNPDAIVLSDIPLLIETGVRWYFDLIVLVYALPSQQIERLVERNGCGVSESKKRLASQMPIGEKILQADVVIDNSASLDETRRKVDELWEYLNRRRLEKQ